METVDRAFGDLLLERGLLSNEQLSAAVGTARSRREPLERVLVDLQLAPKDDIMWARAEQLGKLYVDLADRRIDPVIAQLVPEQLARRYHLVCIAKVGDKLRVAMADPTDIFALDELRLRTGCAPEPVLAYIDDIDHVLESIYKGEREWQAIVEEKEKSADVVAGKALEEATGDAPMVRLADLIISQAIAQKASDIHIEPFEHQVIVRYRIDGVLRQVMNPSTNVQAALISRIKVMANLDIAEHRVPQDGRIQVDQKKQTYDLRVAVQPCIFGEAVSMRILDRKSVMVDLDELGFNPEILEKWRRLVRLVNGVILVTGPTGSGKSTTLYASLNTINRPERKIITIEDPVEYNIEGIVQVQVNPKTGMTFANGLRAFLRQDPDIMMVGEIRDRETAVTAVQAALTGHLVFSTLHTNDAVSAVTRLFDMGTEPFLIASSVQAVMAQRLVRTVCNVCKRPVSVVKAVAEKFEECGIPAASLKLMKGEGCDNCNHSGYKGRAGIHELMIMSDEMRRLVMERRSATELKHLALAEGLRPLYQDGLLKAASGLTTLEEVVRVAID